jgi:hypothetical protein
MSIENAIMQLADALHKVGSGLHALAAAQSGGYAHQTVSTLNTIVDGPAPKDVEPAKVKAEKAKSKAEKEAPPTEQKAEGAKMSYADFIQKPALDLVKAKGREALSDVLKKFGVTSAKEVPETRWPELRSAIDAANPAEEASLA